MSNGKFRLGRFYNSPYEAAKTRLSAVTGLYNNQDWDIATNRNDLDTYIQILEEAGKNNITEDTLKSVYDYNMLDFDTRMAAIANELRPDNTALERFETIYDEKGNAKKESLGVMTGYEYNKYRINQFTSLERAKVERLSDIERKENLSWIGKLGSSIAGVGLELVEGATNFVDDVTGLITAIGTGAAYTTQGKSFGDGFRKSFEEDYGQLFDTVGFEDWLEDFESKYSYLRDADGNYTSVGKYLAGAANSIGYMLPTMGLAAATGGGSIVTQMTFYTGMAAGNIDEMSETMPASVPTWQIVTNAAIKAAVEYGVEVGLGKILGATNIDNFTFGLTGKAVSETAEFTAKSALASITKDALQEGLEETLQELSGFIVDAGFHVLNSDFGTEGFDIQTLIDSFVMGMLSSFAMSNVKALKDKNIVTIKKFAEDGMPVFDKMGKYESYAYRLSVRNFMETYDKIVKDDKLSNEQRATALGQMYVTAKNLLGIYKEFGEERSQKALKFLKVIEDDAKSGRYNNENIRKSAEEISKIVKNASTELKDKLVKARMTKLHEQAHTNEQSDEKTIESSANTDITPKKVTKTKKVKDLTGGKVLISKDGEKIVTDNNVNIIPEKLLEQSSSSTIYESIVENEIVDKIVKTENFKPILSELKSMYKKYNNEDLTDEDLVIKLLFDENFYKISLMYSDELVSRFLSNFTKIVDVLVSKIDNKEAVQLFTNKYNKIRKNMLTVLINYCIAQKNVDVEQLYSNGVLDKKQYNFIVKHRMNYELYNSITKTTYSKLSNNERTLVDNLLNFSTLSAEQKSNLKDSFNSASVQARVKALSVLDNEYKSKFTGKYNGTIRLTTEFFGNILYNTLLDSLHSPTVDLVSHILNSSDLLKVIQNEYGNVNDDNIIDWIKLKFSSLCKGKYELTFNDNGSPIITATQYNDVKSYESYTDVRAELYSGENLDDRNFTTLSTNTTEIFDYLVSDSIPYEVRLTLSISDILRNPSYLQPSIRSSVENLSYEERFNVIRRHLISKFKTVSIAVKRDGTVAVVNLTPMQNVVKKSFSKSDLAKDDKLSSYVKSKFLTGSGKSTKIQFKKLPSKVNAQYDSAQNVIFVNKNIQEDELVYTVLHEFQHIVQFDAGLNLGFDVSWLKKVPIDIRNKILADFKKHFPELLSSITDVDEQVDVVSSFIYEASGETEAIGYTDSVVDFYPVIVSSESILLPWGTKISYSGHIQNMVDSPIHKRLGFYLANILNDTFESARHDDSRLSAMAFNASEALDALDDFINAKLFTDIFTNMFMHHTFTKVTRKKVDNSLVFSYDGNYKGKKFTLEFVIPNKRCFKLVIKNEAGNVKFGTIVQSDKEKHEFTDVTTDFIDKSLIKDYLSSEGLETKFTASELEFVYESLYNVKAPWLTTLLKQDVNSDALLQNSELFKIVKDVKETSEYYHKLTIDLKSEWSKISGRPIKEIPRDDTFELFSKYKDKALRDYHRLYYPNISYEKFLNLDIPYSRYVYDSDSIDLDVTTGNHKHGSAFLGLDGPTSLPKMFVGFDNDNVTVYHGTVKPKELDMIFIWGFSEFGKYDPRGMYQGYLGVEAKIPNYVLKRNKQSPVTSLLPGIGIFSTDEVVDAKQGYNQSPTQNFAKVESTKEEKREARKNIQKQRQKKYSAGTTEFEKKKAAKISNSTNDAKKYPSQMRAYISKKYLSNTRNDGRSFSNTALKYYEGKYLRNEMIKFLLSIDDDKLKALSGIQVDDYDMASMIKKGILSYIDLTHWFGTNYENCNSSLYKRIMRFIFKNEYLLELTPEKFSDIAKTDILEQYAVIKTLEVLSNGLYYTKGLNENGDVIYTLNESIRPEERVIFDTLLNEVLTTDAEDALKIKDGLVNNKTYSDTYAYFYSNTNGIFDTITSPYIKSIATYYDGTSIAGKTLVSTAIYVASRYQGKSGPQWKSPTVEYGSKRLDDAMVSKDGVSRSYEEILGDTKIDFAQNIIDLSTKKLDDVIRQVALRRTLEAAGKEYDANKPEASSKYFYKVLSKINDSIYNQDNADVAKKNENLLYEEYAKYQANDIYDVDIKVEKTSRDRKYQIDSIRYHANKISIALKSLSNNKKVRDALLKELGEYSNIVDDKFNVNRNAYIGQPDYYINRLQYELARISADITKGYYKDNTTLILKKKIATLEKRIAKSKFKKSSTNEKKFTIEDEKVSVQYDRDVPYVIEQISMKGYQQTSPTKVKNLSNEDDRHFTMSVDSFISANAEILSAITTQDAIDIIDFYSESSALFFEKDERLERLYLYNKICLLYTLIAQNRDGEIDLDASYVEKAERLIKSTVSIGLGTGPIWRTILDKLEPRRTIMKSLAKMSGVDFSDNMEIIDDVSNALTKLSKAKTNDKKELKVLLENVKETRERVYEFSKNQLSKKGSDWQTKLVNFERFMMLSSPSTWVRNISSNIFVRFFNFLSEKLGNLFVGKKKRIKGQYLLTGKASQQSKDFVKMLKDYGFFDLIAGGASKYDYRQIHLKISDDMDISQLTKVIAHSAVQQLYGEQVYISSKDTKTKEALDKVFNWTMKLMSDEKYIVNAAMTYISKMLTEKNIDLSKGMITDDIAKIIIDAYTLATYDYMHKPNVLNKIEQTMKRENKNLWFAYKQIMPFATSALNWFVEGLNYTPVGLVKSIVNFIKLEDKIDKSEKRQQEGKGGLQLDPSLTRFVTVRNMGKGVIGTVGFIAGLLLAITGKAGIDEEDDKIKLIVGNVKLDITELFGTQGICLGMAFVKPKKGDWQVTLSNVLDSLLNDSMLGDLVNNFRYTDNVGDWLLEAPADMLSKFYPNFIKTISNAINRREISYSSGIAGSFERLFVQMLPGVAYTMPAEYDPYTGEYKMKYNLPVYFDVLNKFSPIKIYNYEYTELEDLAINLGIRKSSLKGEYEDIGKFKKSDVRKLNEYYGQRNNQELTDFVNGKVKYKVQDEKTDKYVDLTYSKMTDKQKKSVIERIMSNNAKLAKIYVYTENGGKYYASGSEYSTLRKAGLKNIYKENGKNKGFK